MTDDPLLSLLLSDNEEYRFAEELLKDNNYLLTTTDGAVNATACPYCKTGKLVIRQHTANGSQFLGCSHYSSCNQTFKNLDILTDKLMCSDCQSGYMVKRNGKFGDFLGCTNYPGCTNTIKLR
ncbi:topoisomerase DNA-binding C4 zinc finger domain-containing protein [Parapedobacter pyrenivorans]|uniref:topoisomerase DNA-binding C4 zinc finger domain-containing protein n=1 Tax=Parapedobacter pyrenivorans TaxID=1305674 RepID=UPI00166B8FC9